MRNKLLSSILAGVAIAIGAAVNLSVDSRYIGAALFSVGLFSICSFGWKLFTGQACRVAENRALLKDLPVVWIGNLIGAACMSFFIIFANPAVISAARTVWAAKGEIPLLFAFFGGFCCNILIYIAVEGYRRIADPVGKYLAIIFGVMVFILCRFEHSIADMAYFFLAMCPTFWRSLLLILVVSIGNLLGGFAISIFDMEIKK